MDTTTTPVSGPPHPSRASVPHDDDEIWDFFIGDITNLEAEHREAIAFEAWLSEMISQGSC